jgi:rhombotail lipoprotein
MRTTWLWICFAGPLVAGWAGLWGTRHGVSSRLVDYLYPNGEQPPAVPTTVPHLELPVRVGLAFVAEAYLRSSRGFGTIDQVARLYQLDVIALVSYDQVAVTEDTKASLANWTIAGATFIPGNRNDVQTFVDTVVFDVKTHALLFRAAGTDARRSSSTLAGTAQVVRAEQSARFDAAMAAMTTNLATELELFRERIKSERGATVSQRGGGGLDWSLLLCLALIGTLRRRWQRA